MIHALSSMIASFDTQKCLICGKKPPVGYFWHCGRCFKTACWDHVGEKTRVPLVEGCDGKPMDADRENYFAKLVELSANRTTCPTCKQTWDPVPWDPSA